MNSIQDNVVPLRRSGSTKVCARPTYIPTSRPIDALPLHPVTKEILCFLGERSFALQGSDGIYAARCSAPEIIAGCLRRYDQESSDAHLRRLVKRATDEAEAAGIISVKKRHSTDVPLYIFHTPDNWIHPAQNDQLDPQMIKPDDQNDQLDPQMIKPDDQNDQLDPQMIKHFDPKSDDQLDHQVIKSPLKASPGKASPYSDQKSIANSSYLYISNNPLDLDPINQEDQKKGQNTTCDRAKKSQSRSGGRKSGKLHTNQVDREKWLEPGTGGTAGGHGVPARPKWAADIFSERLEPSYRRLKRLTRTGSNGRPRPYNRCDMAIAYAQMLDWLMRDYGYATPEIAANAFIKAWECFDEELMNLWEAGRYSEATIADEGRALLGHRLPYKEPRWLRYLPEHQRQQGESGLEDLDIQQPLFERFLSIYSDKLVFAATRGCSIPSVDRDRAFKSWQFLICKRGIEWVKSLSPENLFDVYFARKVKHRSSVGSLDTILKPENLDVLIRLVGVGGGAGTGSGTSLENMSDMARDMIQRAEAKAQQCQQQQLKTS